MVTETSVTGPQLITLMSPGTPMSVMSPGGGSTVSMMSSPRSVATVIANEVSIPSNAQPPPPPPTTTTIKVDETNSSSIRAIQPLSQQQSTNWSSNNSSVTNQLTKSVSSNNGQSQSTTMINAAVSNCPSINNSNNNNNNNMQLVNMQQNFYQNGPLTSPIHPYPCQQQQQQPISNNWNTNFRGMLILKTEKLIFKLKN